MDEEGNENNDNELIPSCEDQNSKSDSSIDVALTPTLEDNSLNTIPSQENIDMHVEDAVSKQEEEQSAANNENK